MTFGAYDAESLALMRERGIIQNAENAEDAFSRVLKTLFSVDTETQGWTDHAFQRETTKLVQQQILVFGTPLMANLGRSSEAVAACTVLPLPVRRGTLNIHAVRHASQSMLGKGAGTGYDLSGFADPCRVLHDLNDMLHQINEGLRANNRRPVASMVTLRADHPKVLQFIHAKHHADFSRWRCNISLLVTAELFSAAAQDGQWLLHDDQGLVTDTIAAKQLLHEIAESAHYCAEPGVIFIDRLESDNATPAWPYTSTAPCAEVAMAPGDGCQFGYINLGNLVKNEDFDFTTFAQAARLMTRLLDNAVEYTVKFDHGELPLARQRRRIGVGVLGFADMLVKLKLAYDDPRAIMLARQVSEALDYYTKVASVELAKSRGAFAAYYKSRYTDHAWLRRKLVFSTGCISLAAWESLYKNIETYGIRNASTTALPPTGTSSAILHASKSIEPLFSLADEANTTLAAVDDQIKLSTRLLYGRQPKSMLPESTLRRLPYLRTARQLAPTAHIAIQAAFQTFLDDAISKTINLPRSAVVDDVLAAIWAAHDTRLRGITVFRDGCLGERALPH